MHVLPSNLATASELGTITLAYRQSLMKLARLAVIEQSEDYQGAEARKPTGWRAQSCLLNDKQVLN